MLKRKVNSKLWTVFQRCVRENVREYNEGQTTRERITPCEKEINAKATYPILDKYVYTFLPKNALTFRNNNREHQSPEQNLKYNKIHHIQSKSHLNTIQSRAMDVMVPQN